MKSLVVIYIIVQIVFIFIAFQKLNMPEGLLVTIIPALIIAFVIRRIFFGKIS